jgi:ribosome-binding protein aMBF1 (putative translation factor)
MPNFGERVTAAREDRGWSRQDLADHAGLPVRTIYRAEEKASWDTLSVRVATAIVNALELDLGDVR